jgi:exopolyphosphatase / guanosine-5'-triphosphate,3'-diphosphate pyrophosphatase
VAITAVFRYLIHQLDIKTQPGWVRFQLGFLIMRIAIIDLGTNSIRFDVHEVRPRAKTSLIHREKLMVRLGENVFLTGRLDRRAIVRTVQAFEHFRQVSTDLRVNKVVAFATSAMREASDSREMLQKIRRQSRIDVRVISGEEEARLIAQGILKREKMARGSFGLLDIGGGSTEVSVCRDGKILKSESFPLGVARLQQIFLKTSPPQGGHQSIQRLRKHVRDLLEDKIEVERWPSVPRLIGSSGTMRTLARMAKRQTGSKFIERAWLKRLIHEMSEMSVKALSEIDGMEAKRSDLILAGTLVLDETMRALGATRATATDYSLRDGILDHELVWLEPNRPHQAAEFNDFLAKALRFGQDRAHLRWLVDLSAQVFQKLKTVHRLENVWLNYLRVAVLFRDTGRTISPVGHEKHAHYIAKNCDLPFSQTWETDLVAELCLQHESANADVESLPEQLAATQVRKHAFLKLLVLVQIVDALDSGYPRRVRVLRARVAGRKVYLSLSKGASTELVVLKLHRKKDLFQEVFRKTLVIENELSR